VCLLQLGRVSSAKLRDTACKGNNAFAGPAGVKQVDLELSVEAMADAARRD